MRLLFLVLAAFCCFYSPLIGQTKDQAETPEQEITKLRQVLSIPPEKTITFSLSKELPDKNPFKVYGLVISQMDFKGSQEATQSWVENWNKKNANKYGTLEAAPNISEADLIFLWFIYPTQPVSAVVSELGYNPLVHINSYLIVQKPTEAKVVWKFKGLGADYKFSESADKEFKERMKARAKALKK